MKKNFSLNFLDWIFQFLLYGLLTWHEIFYDLVVSLQSITESIVTDLLKRKIPVRTS